jgi:hypothetical protein
MRLPLRSKSVRSAFWAGILLFSVILVSPALVRAQGAAKPSDQSSPSFSLPSKSSGTALSEETGWSWTKMFKPLEFVHGSRRNMVQLATVGMCIALYIIWWRKLDGGAGE